MIGLNYWTTGIKLHNTERGWSAELEFFDDGFCDTASTEGTLRTRYIVQDGTAAQNAIKAAQLVKIDAERLGIDFRMSYLYLHRDNWITSGEETGSNAVEEIMSAVCDALGWKDCRK